MRVVPIDLRGSKGGRGAVVEERGEASQLLMTRYDGGQAMGMEMRDIAGN